MCLKAHQGLLMPACLPEIKNAQTLQHVYQRRSIVCQSLLKLAADYTNPPFLVNIVFRSNPVTRKPA